MLNNYFSKTYLKRLNELKLKVKSRVPETIDGAEEFGIWLQKELDFFYAGTINQLKHLGYSIEKLDNRLHRLLVTVEFINSYILGTITEEEYKKLGVQRFRLRE